MITLYKTQIKIQEKAMYARFVKNKHYIMLLNELVIIDNIDYIKQ